MTHVREPKQDRSRATRLRLLEATIESLAEQGWGPTTVAAVALRAGVSRGAAQHHFPTREDLITAALEYMFGIRMDQAMAEADSLPPGANKTEAIVTGIVEYYTGPMFKAALHVWTAAAADPALKERIVPLEAKFGRVAHVMTARALGVTKEDRHGHELVQATLDLARGLGLADILTDDSGRRRQVTKRWARTLDQALRDRR